MTEQEKQLKKDLWKRFGPVYNSKALREVRNRLWDLCLEEYERQQRQNGLTSEAAVQAALSTLQEVEEARTPYIRKGMAKAYYRGIALTLILSAIPLLFSRGFALKPI